MWLMKRIIVPWGITKMARIEIKDIKPVPT